MDIEKFEKIYRQKIRHNKIKRLSAIGEYLSNNFGIDEDSFIQGNEQQCLQFVMQVVRDNIDESDQVLDDIANLLNDRYSVGEPYFLSILETDLSPVEISSLLQEIYESDDFIEYDSFEFTEPRIDLDTTGKTVELTLRYSEFYQDPTTGEKGQEIYSGKIGIIFDLNQKIALSTFAGYNKVINKLIQFTKESLGPTVNLKQVYVNQQTRNMPNARLTDFDSLTLLVIRMIFDELKRMDYQLNSVDSISFDNDKAPRVKNATLGGKNLFADPDVIERIFNGDKISKFTITVSKYQNKVEVLTTGLTIDFKGMLKIVFSEPNVKGYILKEICQELYYTIVNLLEDKQTIEIGSEIVNNQLSRDAFQSKKSFTQYVTTIEENLIKRIPDKEEEIRDYFGGIKLDIK
ncbi:hypothetical protein NSA56_08995 [Oceanobacillus caeni]|uniref:hypothetical protein n=1 Tax=Oceanobacillus caeni TaxID=405946 RepID=UPI00195BD4D6|nr:hypothetical protein [Oceanobacillus caeni]MCR1834534.1 hypothetical protein [Oceanobacillus caeni]